VQLIEQEAHEGASQDERYNQEFDGLAQIRQSNHANQNVAYNGITGAGAIPPICETHRDSEDGESRARGPELGEVGKIDPVAIMARHYSTEDFCRDLD
jgi:hypothetical protein